MTLMKPFTLGALLPLLSFAGPALAQADRYDGRFYGHMWGSGWGFMGLGMMILFWGVIIFLVVVAVRWMSGQDTSSANRRVNSLDVLKDRLARGEIDVEDYEARKKALED